MTPLFTSLNLLEVYHLKNLLAAEGIASFVKNEMLSRLAGEIPFTECAPQLCLARESDRPMAEQILAGFRRTPVRGPDWTCRDCGEHCEGQFSDCWRCGTPRPD
jgi:hypothetical protein